MKVKTETKEKVARTHECVIDTHKKSLETSAYFMSFLPGIIPDMEKDNEVQGICPHCKTVLTPKIKFATLSNIRAFSINALKKKICLL